MKNPYMLLLPTFSSFLSIPLTTVKSLVSTDPVLGMVYTAEVYAHLVINLCIRAERAVCGYDKVVYVTKDTSPSRYA